MRAFVSYSFQDSELYIVALLFEQLRKRGYTIESSSYDFLSNYSYANYSIQTSDIFLGIITGDSTSINHVIHEWEIAKQNNVRNVLIIEEGVIVHHPEGLNFIRFNRSNPNYAIEKLFRINSEVASSKSNTPFEELLIAGGIIACAAALISLLSGSSKK